MTDPAESAILTPAELCAWRKSLNWSTREAGERLGMAHRAYKYLEQGFTSAGTPRPVVPLYIELAVAELSRRLQEQAGEQRRKAVKRNRA